MGGGRYGACREFLLLVDDPHQATSYELQSTEFEGHLGTGKGMFASHSQQYNNA